ncbi:hypothetical protein B0J18DRAFT_45456 [Chaetomium sp. MPI-SDFR-AT-0129]|uniref:Uncharacterized protein n=1 Tax=Dichotomopilus funicola TaxID=1934379 RepID=A0AAN6V8M9_9PEZI|nr:hypothetical protein B0J18DRAFT_45456 [Chaetomium sp. MPI-SDFR-AT-0129]KAK4146834.1 hypothetical protein C8A04DRAFT_25411 [Dichotomopilus funicola]
MKPVTFLVSALATLAVAAPAAPVTDLEARSFNFDINALNGLQNFQQVNLNYLLNINSLQLGLLGNLASINNFNVLQFQGLFQQQSFDIAALLQLQSLQTFLQIHQLGVLSGFDLASLQLQQLNLGLLNNVGVLDLQQFISPNVVGQVQTVASQPGTFFGPNIPTPGASVNVPAPAPAPVPQPSPEPAPAPAPAPSVDEGSSDTPNVVTADEQEAQEGRGSAN